MKLLLFDLDGTLVLTGGAGTRSLERAFRSGWGVASAPDGISVNGRTDPWILREIFRRKLGREADAAEFGRAAALYLEFLADEVPRSPGYRVLPGVPGLVEALARRPEVLLGLGTGNLERGARIKLERSGLNPRFPFGGFGSDSEDRPAVLRHAIERGSRRAGRPFRPEEVWVVGDTPHDVAAARAVGAVAVTVATGTFADEELRSLGADHHLRDLADPARFLALLDGRG